MFRGSLSEECKGDKPFLLSLPFSFLPTERERQAEPMAASRAKSQFSLHVSSPASRKIFPISEGPGHSEGCPWPPVTPPFGRLGAAEKAPQRGQALSLETCRQQPNELARTVRGSLQMPRKPSCWVTFRSGGPWDYQGSRWPPVADWEVARFSTSELEKTVLGIILGIGSHGNLHELVREAVKSKTMYFDMNQAGETPRSLPRPRNWEFFPQ